MPLRGIMFVAREHYLLVSPEGRNTSHSAPRGCPADNFTSRWRFSFPCPFLLVRSSCSFVEHCEPIVVQEKTPSARRRPPAKIQSCTYLAAGTGRCRGLIKVGHFHARLGHPDFSPMPSVSVSCFMYFSDAARLCFGSVAECATVMFSRARRARQLLLEL